MAEWEPEPYDAEQKKLDATRLIRLDRAVVAQHLMEWNLVLRETPTWQVAFWTTILRKIEKLLGLIVSLAGFGEFVVLLQAVQEVSATRGLGIRMNERARKFAE